MTDLGETFSRHLSLALFSGLLLLLVWAPLPLGGVPAWAGALMNSLLFFLFALWVAGRLLRPRMLPGRIKRLYPALACLLAFLLLQAFTLLPLPADVVRWLNPAAAEWYTRVPGDVAFRLAIDRDAAGKALLANMAMVCLLLLTVAVVNTPRRLRILAVVLVLAAMGQAVFGYATWLMGPNLPAWHIPWDGHHVARGTFINRNHYAALLVLALCVGAGILYGQAGHLKRKGRGRWQALADYLLTARGFLAVGLVAAMAITLFGLYFSFSRGATGSLVLALLGTSALGWQLRGKHSAAGKALPWLVGMVVLVAVVLRPGILLQRFADIPAESSERVLLWRQTLRIFADFPLFGSGGGSWPFLYPHYPAPELGGKQFEHAHNGYLEILSDYGLLGALPLFAAGVLLAMRLVRGFGRSRDRFLTGMLFGCLAGCAAFLLQCTVEFTLHTAGLLAWFIAVLGMGLAATDLALEERTPAVSRRLKSGQQNAADRSEVETHRPNAVH